VLWSAASIAALAFSFAAQCAAEKENGKAAMLAALQSTLFLSLFV
jgi:hypothetical protein